MKTRIGLSLLLATVLGAFCLLTPRVSAGRADANDAHNYCVTYRLGDLPVWTKDGKCESKVLLRYIQDSISPESWEAGDGTSSLAPYPQNASVVISTTQGNHEKISDLLDNLRQVRGDEN